MMVEENDAGAAGWVDSHAAELPPIADVTTVLQALGDPVRIAIVRSLAAAGTELACGVLPLPVTKSTATHHFRVLREAGLITGRYEGTRKMLRLRRAELDAAYPGLLAAVLSAPAAEPAVR
jgi:DNA-binding transcriptional ArsR family regulator